jgi:hypothetical protein
MTALSVKRVSAGGAFAFARSASAATELPTEGTSGFTELPVALYRDRGPDRLDDAKRP